MVLPPHSQHLQSGDFEKTKMLSSSTVLKAKSGFHSHGARAEELHCFASLSVRFSPQDVFYHSQSSVVQKHARNVSHVPLIRAQASPIPDYVPEAKFYKVEAILRPWRVPHVSSALLKIGIRGVTVSDVRGFGAQGSMTERQAGSEFSEDKFVAKVKMEIVVSKDQVEAVIDQIIQVARTGEIGDGKIFVVPVADVIRVRTGERGEKAERMVGGRADMKVLE